MGGSSGGPDHPPMLPPGQSTSFTYLLQQYDLKPGRYELTAAGKAGVVWKYYGGPRSGNDPPPPPPKHKETDPVAGAEFERTVTFTVTATTEDELRAVLSPLVADADLVPAGDGSKMVKRLEARAALIESAPPFLVSVIARFAAEDQYNNGPAIEALGRMASAESRAHLKSPLRAGNARRDGQVMLALARIGHPDDADFMAGVLQDTAFDEESRRLAAFGLGYIGGERAVRHLEAALGSARERLLETIVIALGNTRSRAAVPVIIGAYGHNPARNGVCGAMKTLTHQDWCDGSDTDPAAVRRQWLRRWNEGGARTPIFGLDTVSTVPRLRRHRRRLLALVRHHPARQPSWRRTLGLHRGTPSSASRATTSDSKTGNPFASSCDRDPSSVRRISSTPLGPTIRAVAAIAWMFAFRQTLRPAAGS